MEAIKDLVSVIIPTYNRAHLIKRSAMSVLNQTYSNLELIIVDDGSTDNTEEVVKSINDNRVIYIKQPNQGACAARNNGIDHAQGEFIAFQDSDDVWHVDKLEKQVKCLKEIGADVVVCNYSAYKRGKLRKGNKIHKEGFIPKDYPPIVIGTQTFLGKSIIFKEFKFDNRVQKWQDFEILIRIHKKYLIYFLNLCLIDYFIQEDSVSFKKQNQLLNTWEIIFDNTPNFKTIYANNTDLIAYQILTTLFSISDKDVKNNLKNLAFSFNNSLLIKIKYFVLKIKFLLKKIQNAVYNFRYIFIFSLFIIILNFFR